MTRKRHPVRDAASQVQERGLSLLALTSEAGDAAGLTASQEQDIAAVRKSLMSDLQVALMTVAKAQAALEQSLRIREGDVSFVRRNDFANAELKSITKPTFELACHLSLMLAATWKLPMPRTAEKQLGPENTRPSSYRAATATTSQEIVAALTISLNHLADLLEAPVFVVQTENAELQKQVADGSELPKAKILFAHAVVLLDPPLCAHHEASVSERRDRTTMLRGWLTVGRTPYCLITDGSDPLVDVMFKAALRDQTVDQTTQLMMAEFGKMIAASPVSFLARNPGSELSLG